MARFQNLTNAAQSRDTSKPPITDGQLVKLARGYAPQRVFARMVGCSEVEVADYEAGRLPVPEHLRDYCSYYLSKLKPKPPVLSK